MVTKINALAMRSSGGMTRRGSVLQGCLIALAVVVALIVAGVVLIMVYWKSIAAAGMSKAMEVTLDEAPISETEKAEIRVELDELIAGFENGDVSVEELAEVVAQVVEGPLLPAGAVFGTYSAYFEPSDLSDEEKADAKVQLSRLARGLADESITMVEMRDVLKPIEAGPGETSSVQFGHDNVQMTLKEPEDVTGDELREFVSLASTLADEKEIDAELYELDISDEISKAIDIALGRAEAEDFEEEAAEDDAAADDAESETDDGP